MAVESHLHPSHQVESHQPPSHQHLNQVERAHMDQAKRAQENPATERDLLAMDTERDLLAMDTERDQEAMDTERDQEAMDTDINPEATDMDLHQEATHMERDLPLPATDMLKERVVTVVTTRSEIKINTTTRKTTTNLPMLHTLVTPPLKTLTSESIS